MLKLDIMTTTTILKYRLLYIFFLLVFSVIFSRLSAQFYQPGDTTGYIDVNGYIERNNKPLENASIMVFENGKKIATIKTLANGRFNLKFVFNRYIKVEITKADLVTKRFEFDTHLPDSLNHKYIFPFSFNIVLFPRYDYIDMSILKKPLAIIKFQKRFNDFFYDYNYAKTINDKVRYIEKKVDDLSKEYALNINDGTNLFNSQQYETAIIKFQRAHDIFPDEAFPVEKLAAINKILNEQKAKKALYDGLISQAEDNAKQGSYESAIDLLEKANKVLPEENYPAQRIKDLRLLMSKIADKENRYKEALSKADKDFDDKNYQEAKFYYLEALNLFPIRSYPKTRIDEIDIIYSRLSNDELYNKNIKDGDRFMAQLQYQDAITSYNKALSYKPDEAYPKDKISQINSRLTEKANIDLAYNRSVSLADKLYKDKEYESAVKNYYNAISLKPSESYPADRIKEIKIIISEINAKEENYKNSISKADNFFNNKDYDKALELYKLSLTYKPDESYPDVQIAKINDLNARQTKMNNAYLQIISKANELYVNKNYQKARNAYQDALRIKPDEQSPKDKIAEIDRILKIETEKLENYWKAIETADLSFDLQEYPKARKYYMLGAALQPDEMYCKDKTAEVTKIIQTNQSTDDSYSRMKVAADIAFSSKYYDKATELYKKALDIKPEETYPKDKLKEIDALVKVFEANNKQYVQTIEKADELFYLGQYKDAREMYKKARELNPLQQYPKKQIYAINNILRSQEFSKAIGEVNNEIIEKLTEKKYSFIPLSDKGSANCIIIEATNLSRKHYKVLVYYGKNEERSGGFEIDVEKTDSIGKYRVRVGLQENWIKQQNNWISIQPIGGDLELNSLQIVKGE